MPENKRIKKNTHTPSRTPLN